MNKGLVTNYEEGGATKREGGGAREVLPLRKASKGGAEKVFAMLKGRGQKRFWGSFYTVA